MEPEEALHWHILRRKRDGVEDQIDAVGREDRRRPDAQRRAAAGHEGGRRQVRRRRADPALRAAERRGHEARRGAGWRSYLDRIEGYTKGTVVLATVFGDVHDIGKSLVNTILTNNGYTVVDLGKQVPIGTILDAAEEHDATAIGLSALLVSTSKQMPLAVAGAARSRAARSRCSSAAPRSTATSAGASSTPAARSPRRSTSPASSTARTPSRASP